MKECRIVSRSRAKVFQSGHLDMIVSGAIESPAHATGHESRMRRDLSNAFGSEKYALEELRAEMSAAMTAAALGIGFDPEAQNIEEGREIGNTAAYLSAWLSRLPENERVKLIMAAIKDAQQISDYLLDRVLGACTEEASKAA